MGNEDSPEHKTSCIVFYPLSCSNSRLNGIGIADNPISLSVLFSISEFFFIKFFNEEIFFFQKKHTETEEKPFIYDGKISYSEEAGDMSSFTRYRDNNGNLNLLKHITLKSKEMKGKIKDCLLFAIDSGFPNEQFVDFESKKLIKKRYILQKWEKTIKSQSGDLEKDFTNTISDGVKILLNEYSDLFNRIEIMSEESLFSSLKLLTAITKLPFFSSPERTILPKIFFRKVTIKMIVHINRDGADDLCKRIESEFEKYGYNIEYRIAKAKGMRTGNHSVHRTKIILFMTFPEFISLNEIKYCIINFKNESLDILEEVDSNSYERFLNHVIEEIWIKKIDIYVLIGKESVDVIRNLIGKFFHGIQKKFSIRHLDEENSAVKITLTLNRFSDFSISERSKIYDFEDKRIGITLKEIYNPIDRYTRIAVEEMYAKNFGEALKYLKKAKYGLLGDFYSIKYSNTDSKERFSYHYEAINCYEEAGIGRHTEYMENPSEVIVRRALKVNGWWRVSLRLYLKARDMLKQRDWDITVGDEKVTKMDKKLLRKYRALQSRRNIDDFTRIMGDFYKSLLLETQKESRDFAGKVLGYAI